MWENPLFRNLGSNTVTLIDCIFDNPILISNIFDNCIFLTILILLYNNHVWQFSVVPLRPNRAMVLRPTWVRFGKGWILTGWFRVCWKRDGEKNEDRNCISGVGERQKREYQKHVRRVCSVGKTEKEEVVVKGKEVEEVESEE